MEPQTVKRRRIDSGVALRSELITAACAVTGQAAELVAVIVDPIVKHLQVNYGGDKLYIPAEGRTLDEAQVYHDYLARHQVKRICRDHAISPRTFYRIIDEALARTPRKSR